MTLLLIFHELYSFNIKRSLMIKSLGSQTEIGSSFCNSTFWLARDGTWFQTNNKLN